MQYIPKKLNANFQKAEKEKLHLLLVELILLVIYFSLFSIITQFSLNYH